MSREYQIEGVFVSETTEFEYQIETVYINETQAAAAAGGNTTIEQIERHYPRGIMRGIMRGTA